MKDTRTKILDIAEKLIISKGYNAFSYGDISEEVGIKTASIHYHFPTKAELCVAIVKRHNEIFASKLKDIRVESDSGLMQIQKFSELMLRAFDNGRGFCLCLSLASDETSMCNETKGELKSFFKDSEKWLSKSIVQGQEDGEIFSNMDCNKTATAIISMLEGAMVLSRAYGHDAPLKSSIECVKEMLTT